jgi:hypothetical protein
MQKKTTKAAPVEKPPRLMPVPEFGKHFFNMSEPSSYAAAKRGDFPVIKIGKLMFVPYEAGEQMIATALKSRETSK